MASPYAGNVLRSTNALLEKVGIQSHIESFKELTGSASSMFVAVFEKAFGVLLDAIIRKPVHVRDYVHNANVVMGALQDRVLHMPLPNINGEAIVRGDATAIHNLVSIFSEIVAGLDEAESAPGDLMPVPQTKDGATRLRIRRRRRSHRSQTPVTERFPLDIGLSSPEGFAFSGEASEDAAQALGASYEHGDVEAIDEPEPRPLPQVPPEHEAPARPPIPPQDPATLPNDLSRLALDYPRLWERIAEEADAFAAREDPDAGARMPPRPLDSPGGPSPSGSMEGAGQGIRKLRATLRRMQREQNAVARQQARLENRRLAAAARSKQHQRRAQQAQWRKHAEALQLQLLSQQLRRQNHEHVKLRQLYRAVLRSARQLKHDEAMEGATRAKELERTYGDLCESTVHFFDDRLQLISDAGVRAREAQSTQIKAQRALLQRLLDEAKAANETAVHERLEKLALMEDESLRVMSELQTTASALLHVDDWEAALEDRFLGTPSAAAVDAQMKRGRVLAGKKREEMREKRRMRLLRRAYGS